MFGSALLPLRVLAIKAAIAERQLGRSGLISSVSSPSLIAKNTGCLGVVKNCPSAQDSAVLLGVQALYVLPFLWITC